MSFDTLDTDSIATAGITFSAGNLAALGGGTSLVSSGIAQTLEGKKSGKWYVEFTCNAVSGNTDGVGLLSSNNLGGNGFIGDDFHSQGWGFYTNSHVVNGTASVTAVNNTTYGAGDVIGIAIDLTNKKVWFRKNTGSWIGTSGTPDPATNTNGFDLSNILSSNKRCYVAINNSGTTAKFTANFGASTFTGTVPTGFTAGWTNTTAGTYFGTFARLGPGQQNFNTLPAGDIGLSKYVSTVTGKVTAITSTFNIAGGTISTTRVAIYADSSGAPGALLGLSTGQAGDGTGFGEIVWSFANISVTAGTAYWIGFVLVSTASQAPEIYCSALTNGILMIANASTFPAANNPYGSSTSSANFRLPFLISVTPRNRPFVQACG
jgi:hypothetical protein